MGYHLVTHLARLLLWLLGPISPTPHHILALDIPSPLQYFLLQLISCRSNLVPAMDQDEMEELYPSALPHVLRQHDSDFAAGGDVTTDLAAAGPRMQRHGLRFDGSSQCMNVFLHHSSLPHALTFA
jgi:hypothetical protein